MSSVPGYPASSHPSIFEATMRSDFATMFDALKAQGLVANKENVHFDSTTRTFTIDISKQEKKPLPDFSLIFFKYMYPGIINYNDDQIVIKFLYKILKSDSFIRS